MAATFPYLHYIANLQIISLYYRCLSCCNYWNIYFIHLFFVIFQCKTSCLYWWRCWG